MSLLALVATQATNQAMLVSRVISDVGIPALALGLYRIGRKSGTIDAKIDALDARVARIENQGRYGHR